MIKKEEKRKWDEMKLACGYSGIETNYHTLDMYDRIYTPRVIYLVDDWDLFVNDGYWLGNKNIQLYYIKKEEDKTESFYIIIEQYEEDKLKWNGIFHFIYNDMPVPNFNKSIYLMFKEKYPIFDFIADEKEKIDLTKFSLKEEEVKPWYTKEAKNSKAYNDNIYIQLSMIFHVGEEGTHVHLEYNKWYYKFKVIFLSVNIMWVSYNDIVFIILEHEKNKYKLSSFISVYDEGERYLNKKRKYYGASFGPGSKGAIGLKYHLARILSSWEFGSKGNVFEQYNDDNFLNSIKMRSYMEEEYE